MGEISIIGLDLAKQVFQVHGADKTGRCLLRKQLKRREVLRFFAGLSPCLVAMEACGSAHDWAREIARLGHDARLLPPAYVKPYVKRGKTDRIDAEAICEAASRPTMRFVPVKTIEQQSLATLHRCRDLLVKNRTMLVNALRAHLAEFGFIAAKGIGKLPDLIKIVSEAAPEALPEMARAPLLGFIDAIALINQKLDGLEKRLRAWHKGNAQSQRLETVPGVGLIGSLANKTTPLALWVQGLLARRSGRAAAVALANKLARIAWAIMASGKAYKPLCAAQLQTPAVRP